MINFDSHQTIALMQKMFLQFQVRAAYILQYTKQNDLQLNISFELNTVNRYSQQNEKFSLHIIP